MPNRANGKAAGSGRYWRARRRAQLVPAPFLSARGHPLLVLRHSSGSLEMLIEATRLRGMVWWDELPRPSRAGEPCEGSDKRLSPAQAHVLKNAGSILTRERLKWVTGPLFERGVHLAPWASYNGGRAFVAISADHRLVAQSDCHSREDEADVRRLLLLALDIADPQDETTAASAGGTP